MSKTKDKDLFNTIYIMSKGRPWCSTAETLLKINYHGEWFIVCGDNDETIPEYIGNYGDDKVIIFNWRKYAMEADFLDNFDIDDMPSGAVPARNAIADISASRGELRHWQFDDDFTGFRIFSQDTGKNEACNGNTLYKYMNKIAMFARDTNTQLVSFSGSAIEAKPARRLSYGKCPICALNMPSSSNGFIKWSGRLCDDDIQNFKMWQSGKIGVKFRFLQYGSIQDAESLTKKGKQAQSGGNTDVFNRIGSMKKRSYELLICPNAIRIGWGYSNYRKIRWDIILPKIISEKFKKNCGNQYDE